MPQIIEGVQSQSAGPFAQNILNQAGDARGARINIMLQKKRDIFAQLERLRREREIKKQEDEANKISAAQIGAIAGAVIAAPFTGGMSLAMALTTIGAGTSIGGGIGGLFEGGGNVQTSTSNIASGARIVDSMQNEFFKVPSFNPPGP